MILILIMVINALAYGTIIPLLYKYTATFGIRPFGLSLLFASFSLAQFISTPILGRLSDKFGRKPVLLICLLGTGLSLFLFASAQSVFVLFLARILDGVTGGNVSVAQAIIADTTKGEERAKAFGLLGASFGFGFLFGPAIGGLLSSISLTAPFWLAGAVAVLGTILGYFVLPETLQKTTTQSQSSSILELFQFKKILIALFQPLTGTVLLLSFLVTMAFNGWIIGFQTVTNDVLLLSAQTIGLMFACSGVISVLMQAVGIRIILQKIPSKKIILNVCLIGCLIISFLFYFATSMIPFFILVLAIMIFVSPINVVITSLISDNTKAEDQGGILGINQSYISLGQIVGPLIAGSAANINVTYIFLVISSIFAATLFGAQFVKFATAKKLDL